MEQTVTAPRPRLVYIDNLRWLMIVLVVLVHVCVTYSGLGSWYYKEERALDVASALIFYGFEIFCQAFFMGFLFLLAGHFVPAAYDRKGCGRYLLDRFVRLGVPTLIFMFVLHPVTVLALEARLRSEELLGQLQESNRRLKIYAERAEEVAAAQERTRLARELHDAVTQTVFSINLTAEAARLACDQAAERVPGMLERLQELGREALAEMRSLVDELRPHAVADVGLVRALEKHLAMRRRRDQLEVELGVAGEERGSLAVKEALFRTAQESLNNVLRHSGVRTATIHLSFSADAVTLRVNDHGCGFVPAENPGGESYGLINMRERVEAAGGEFRLRTAPGEGTEIEARVPPEGGGGE